MKPFPKNPYVFMLLYAWKNKGLFFLIVFFLMASIITDKMVPYTFSKLVGLFGEGVIFADIKSSFIICFIVMILCKILAEIFIFLKDYFTKIKFEPLVFQQLNADLFLYLSQHSVNFFANNMAGSLANKSYTLAGTTADFYGSSLYYIFSILELLFTFFMFLFIDVHFAFAFLFALVLSLSVFIHIGKKSISLRAQMAEARNKLAGNMIDVLQNSFFVRLFNGFSYESKRALKNIEKETDITQKSVTIESCLGYGQTLYFGIFYLLMLLYGFQLWKTEQIDTAQLVLVFLLLKDVIMHIHIVLMRAVTFSGVIQEIRTNLVIFATPHDIIDSSDAKQLKVKKGKIEFKDVTFGYDSKHLIFKNFSLTIDAGQKIGIVGMSGSGKSTFINLIERFYDVLKGKIVIDGQDILRTVTQQSLHESIGYIAQTTTLFERSIAENIAYGKPNATQTQIVAAAKNAYAHDFIDSLPNKYMTLLNGDNQLSGGQKQRLSIARAILKNAPILILDEATSALDSESEYYIQQAIDKIIQDKTVIAIAHRLSTLKNMDRIIVLDKGKIVEDGTLKELLKKNGAFANFWNLQQLEEKKHE